MTMTKEEFKKDFVEKLETKLGRSVEDATAGDCYYALGSLVREYAGRNWLRTTRGYRDNPVRQVYYFSMEFLLGRLMANNLHNLGIYGICREALAELGFDLDDVLEQEPDAGLGNGGLGRLAACFLDSLASLQYPGHGCGIRYKYGLFEQKIVDGYQVEMPDYWLKKEYVWEVRRADRAVEVRFGGEVEPREENGRLVFEHRDYETVLAVPYDVPIIGYGNRTVNTLRLWSAEPAPHNYRFHGANDYYKILDYNRTLELISGFLYPDDSSEEGRLLRLKQQYFLVSAGLQSILNHYKKRKSSPLADLPKVVALHINDTHPTLIIPELMRILMDEEGLGWDEAWRITTQTVSYTNHTIMSEALEKWPVGMVKKTLPRIFMIIEEINERFCRELFERHRLDLDRIAQMAIVAWDEVRMAHLAIAGSCSVNGVAKLHTEILKKQVMKDFHDIYPWKFNNKTNGITHRRWLLNANPGLAALITESIGSRWIRHPKELLGIIKYAADPGFREKIREIKRNNKRALARLIRERKGIAVDEESIFDVQIKRIHAYKRQLLNAMHIIDLYLRLKENPGLDIVPRTFIIGGKAAPAYHFAKQVIKLVNTLADVINNDPAVRDKIKVVFMDNYSVTLAERIIPAADVSEQISTASKEASGTGNMKFMMNGALTIGTMDGANIEMAEAVGRENMFIFGLTSDQVIGYYTHGGYSCQDLYNGDPRIRRVVDQLLHLGDHSWEKSEFHDLYYSLFVSNDEFFVLKDFDAYVEAQELVDLTYRDQPQWLRKAIINIAHSGKFSTDRTIAEYATEIWKLRPFEVN
jgi:starch phosphorylase